MIDYTVLISIWKLARTKAELSIIPKISYFDWTNSDPLCSNSIFYPYRPTIRNYRYNSLTRDFFPIFTFWFIPKTEFWVNTKCVKKVRLWMLLVLVVVLKKKTDKSITLISHTDHTTNKLLVFHIICNIVYGFNKVKIELRP